MRLKDLAALLMSAAALVTSITGLVKAFRNEATAHAADELLYDQAATGVAENADAVMHVKERLVALEKGKTR